MPVDRNIGVHLADKDGNLFDEYDVRILPRGYIKDLNDTPSAAEAHLASHHNVAFVECKFQQFTIIIEPKAFPIPECLVPDPSNLAGSLPLPRPGGPPKGQPRGVPFHLLATVRFDGLKAHEQRTMVYLDDKQHFFNHNQDQRGVVHMKTRATLGSDRQLRQREWGLEPEGVITINKNYNMMDENEDAPNEQVPVNIGGCRNIDNMSGPSRGGETRKQRCHRMVKKHVFARDYPQDHQPTYVVEVTLERVKLRADAVTIDFELGIEDRMFADGKGAVFVDTIEYELHEDDEGKPPFAKFWFVYDLGENMHDRGVPGLPPRPLERKEGIFYDLAGQPLGYEDDNGVCQPLRNQDSSDQQSGDQNSSSQRSDDGKGGKQALGDEGEGEDAEMQDEEIEDDEDESDEMEIDDIIEW